MKKLAPSQEYRLYIRDVRMFMEPKHEGLLLGEEKINDLCMNDLETLYELVMGFNPKKLRPKDYQCRH